MRAKYIQLCIFLIPFVTVHLQAGESKVDSIQGVWKSTSSEETGNTGWIVFLEIGRDYFIYDDEREGGLIFEEREGDVLIRKGGLNGEFIRVVMRGDHHIVFEPPGRKISFIRSSMEEKLGILSPPVSAITGRYRSEDGSLLFEFSENKVVRNGKSLNVSLIGVNRMYRAVSGNTTHFGLTPDGEKRLLYREWPGALPVVLHKVTAEKADGIREDSPQPRQVQQFQDTQVSREARTQRTFRRIDNGLPTSQGGPAKHRRAAIRFSGAAERYLQNKYPVYMDKLARQLQNSFSRCLMLEPKYTDTGQVSVIFGIAPDGSLESYTAVSSTDGSGGLLRSLSERALIDAFPCDPPGSEMLDDPMFSRISATFSIN